MAASEKAPVEIRFLPVYGEVKFRGPEYRVAFNDDGSIELSSDVATLRIDADERYRKPSALRRFIDWLRSSC